MSKESSCINCKKRHPGCHSDCDFYIEWKKEQTEKKKLIKKNLRNKNIGYYHK